MNVKFGGRDVGCEGVVYDAVLVTIDRYDVAAYVTAAMALLSGRSPESSLRIYSLA